ncbi:MAG: hypothetical protein OEV55_10200, partial [candidate division Zixibacteria bacterium]|nr:hypothetical protein [candidate division Zixibacteria bacterium]
MKKITILSGFLIGLILLCYAPSSIYAREYSFPIQKEFTLQESLVLEMEDPRGEIILESHNQNKIIIHAIKIVEARDSDQAEALARKIGIEIKKFGSSVLIKTKYQKVGGSFLEKLLSVKKSVDGYVNYHILVPKNINEAKILVTSGEIKVFYLNGNLNLISTSGDLEITGVKGNITGTVTSGNIQLKEIQGE